MTKLDLAQQCFMRGAFGEAVEALESLGEPERSRPDVLLFWGVCLARVRRIEESASVLGRALKADPDCFEAITWMAVLKKNRREIAEAIQYAERAIELQPDNAVGYGALGACYLYVHQAAPAIEAFQRAAALAPGVAEHHHNLGLAYLMQHRNGEGVEHLQRAIGLAPRNAQSYLALANQHSKHGDAGRAIECLSEGLRLIPHSAALNGAIAGVFATVRNDAAAEAHHRRAMSLSPQEAEGPYAAWLLNQGRFAEAGAIYEGMLQNPQQAGLGYYGLAQCRKFTAEDEPMVRRMEELREEGDLSSLSELHLRYALGKVNEGRGRYEEAMADYDAANALAFQLHNTDVQPTEFECSEENRRVVELYDRLLPRSAEDSQSEVPIFIVGMIRSGTTLLDQILSSHPSVNSAGELQFWTEETVRMAFGASEHSLQELADEYLTYLRLLAGESERITDKMPLNFAYTGVIHRALPKARFIHIRRHPVDTCLSIYTTYYGPGPRFAYDKANVVAYYREYERMMRFWRERIPTYRLMEVDYEQLIAEPESLIPRIIEFCGLPWDDACLHHERNESAINTPSRWQARQPIYKTSIERWKRFEPWLGEFGSLLSGAGSN